MYILASASPRRRELITHITSDYIIDIPQSEENCPESVPLLERPLYLACQKAGEVAARNGGKTVIAADTAVFLDGVMLGKPKDADDAKAMLRALSDNTHFVVTGCCIKRDRKEASFSTLTEVTFYPLSDEEIDDYVKTGEPLDKAGAYGVQGKGAVLVKKINGDYYNVVGFPVAEIKRKLKEFEKDS